MPTQKIKKQSPQKSSAQIEKVLTFEKFVQFYDGVIQKELNKLFENDLKTSEKISGVEGHLEKISADIESLRQEYIFANHQLKRLSPQTEEQEREISLFKSKMLAFEKRLQKIELSLNS